MADDLETLKEALSFSEVERSSVMVPLGSATLWPVAPGHYVGNFANSRHCLPAFPSYICSRCSHPPCSYYPLPMNCRLQLYSSQSSTNLPHPPFPRPSTNSPPHVVSTTAPHTILPPVQHNIQPLPPQPTSSLNQPIATIISPHTNSPTLTISSQKDSLIHPPPYHLSAIY
ncbi:hypothetical protein Salat_1219200 [Sesamum alatum]|uniref:Uncharacterized protein n=1 Tax=Sesamum alatum TaxID=300844 RepID=A0AAE1YFG3_9LAMI|nr:hypothetical protein Salat_1219200 [Sesamum alatum]